MMPGSGPSGNHAAEGLPRGERGAGCASNSSGAFVAAAVGTSGPHPPQGVDAVGGVRGTDGVGGGDREEGSSADSRASVGVAGSSEGLVVGWPERNKNEATALLRRLACCLGSGAGGL